MKLIHKFNGTLKVESEHKPLKVRIFEPIRNSIHGDYYCVVQIVPILRTEKKIFGVDAEQAISLAMSFTKDLLAGWIVLEENGINIDPAALFD